MNYQSNKPDIAQLGPAQWLAIGIQPQWGFTNNTGRPYITFPFKFSNVFTAISCICHNGSPSEANTVYNVSISGMNIGASGGGSGKYWCAFGVAQQQWGYQTVHGTNPVTYDLPIPFEEAPFTVAISTGNSGNHASCGGFTKTTIVLRAGTTAGVWDTVGFFIIGCQLQWGMNIHGWVIFPIPFTKFRRLVTNHQGNVFMDSKARESNTLSGFTLDVADNSDQNKDAQWIAIGA